MNKKIGMYTTDEILEYMTDCEGAFLGRSMYDAIFGKIDKLQQKNKQLKQQLKDKDEKISKIEKLTKQLKGSARYQRCMDELDYILNIIKED